MSGTPALTYATNVVFRCPNFWSLHDKKKGYRYIFIGPEGTWCTLVAIDGYDRFRFSIIGNEIKETLTAEQVSDLIVRAMGRKFDFEIQTIVPWVRRELVADSYGAGRAFIAGDAAHLNSPTGAFGMNTGMQDAVDLGWKLWATLGGWGGPELLASYEVERRPVALRNVEEASANLRRMLSPRLGVPDLLFTPGPNGDAVRRSFGEAFTQQMKHEWFTLSIHLGYRYDGSPVIVPDGTPAPDEPPMTYTQTARPGSRAPHVWIEPGRSTLDLFGRGYVLLRFDENAEVSAIEDAAARRGVPLEVIALANADARRLYVNKLVLVRPDGFVAWRGDAIGADADTIMEIVTGNRYASGSRASNSRDSMQTRPAAAHDDQRQAERPARAAR
jgi:hypothetical protein